MTSNVDSTKSLLGVVMCGGRSTRMGEDKGLLLWQNTIWAQILRNMLMTITSKTLLSINSEQLSSYSNIFSLDDTIVDSINIPGPVGGILSVHKAYPKYNLLVVACDMLLIKKETIHNLVMTYQKENQYDFYLYKNGERYEPLLCIYTHNGLSKAYNQLMEGTENTNHVKDTWIPDSGKKSNISLSYLLSLGKSKILQTKDTQKDDFININDSKTLQDIHQKLKVGANK